MSQESVVRKELHAQSQSQAPLCIDKVFELQTRKTPDAVAVSFGEQRLTYRELDERASRLAHYLQQFGVRPEVPVALYLDRSLETAVAILGVLKAGGAYVPMDLAYPKERLSFMLEDTQAPVVLTQQTLRSGLPDTQAQVICLEADWEHIGRESAVPPVLERSADSAAYIIYTSGSTGKPKGVLVTHHNVVRLFQQTAPWYGFNASDVWPWFHSYAFDVSVWEMWGALFHGGRLVVVPYLVTRSPADFYELLARERATVLNQTPSAFRQLIWAEATAATPHALPLRYVICAGEALELHSLQPWFDRHGDETPQVINMYGITETTVHTTYRRIRQEDLSRGLGSVIGVPIPDLCLYLVDEQLRPVPRGEPGEICVGGAGVARGYLNRPELSRKRFLSDCFSGQPGARLYRSGDLARYTEQGELEYLGRMDHQVKIRGFRVELGEIESALNRHPAVRESVVLAREASGGDKRLVAYVVPAQTAKGPGAGPSRAPTLTVTELRESLGQTLPDYMVPALFVFLEALPLTTNGKVDRRALPEPEGVRPELKQAYVAPRSPTEQALAQIWSQVLEVDQVGIHDNLFELGGDSIRSITILSRAQEQGWQLSLAQLFEHPTVAALAVCAETNGPAAQAPPSAPFSLLSPQDRAKLPADVEDAYPLSQMQLSMFYSNELNPASAMYHDVFSFRIQAAWDRDKLQAAIHRLVQRHPMLRTSFHLAGFSQPLQLVHHRAFVPLTVEDLRALAPAAQEQQLAEWVEREKRTPLERAVAPMLRFHAQWRDPHSFQFICSFHHVCLDGWSLAAVMTELFQEYSALLEGVEPTLTAPRLAYRDFVALEQQALASVECRRFWQAKLQDATVQRLPRWPKALRAGGQEQVRGPEIHLEASVFEGLKRLAQQARVPLKSVLLAAHQHVMGTLYGQSDVTSGLILNGRPEATDGEKLIGLFLNTLPLRMQLQGGTWRELVQQAFGAEQQILPHRRLPLAEIQKLHGGAPLLETAFDFVHFHVYKHLQGRPAFGFQEGHYFEANSLTTYTTFMLDVTSTQLEFHLDYDPNQLCREQVEQISQYYLRTLQAMAAEPEGRYETFSSLTDAENQRLLVEWNATRQEMPAEQGLEQLFAARVAHSPYATAVVCEGRQLTYAELNERAEGLARYLRQLGVGPEVLVGLCLERSVQMVVGLLGILKAGGAYLPLDPSYPRERLAFMLEDAKPALVLSEPALLRLLPPTPAKVLCLTAGSQFDCPPGTPAAAPRGLEPAPLSALAYVLYTSGSTGTPKGVAVERRSLVNLLRAAARTLGVTPQDNFVAVTTLAFDIAALELFLPLTTGGTLTLAGRVQAADGVQLAALIDACGATVLQGTPATWRLLLESGWPGRGALKAICGGEALTRKLADALLARTAALWNFYGPTETTIWSSAWRVEPGEHISIGRPLANTQFYLLDSHRRPVPVGTAGELYIGGDGVARGYLNRPELTAEKFLPNPFLPGPGNRLYRTGDLARYLPDGSLEWLGRLDQQVKVNGFRIELGEVEAALRQYPGIANAVVAARADASGDKKLVGYLISRNGPPAIAELREFLRTKLPAYMVPTQFAVLEAFPLTANGKIDIRQLPAPESAAPPALDYVPPRTPEEQRLAEILAEVLAIKQAGIDDNFFDLGCDSLAATRAFARINTAFGANITLRDMLDYPTIRSLAEVVSQRKGRARTAPRRPDATVMSNY